MSALLMIAALVAADDGAMVRCAMAKLPPTDLVTLQRGMVASVTTGGKRSTGFETLVATLRDNAAACTDGSDADDARAGEIAVSSVAVESLSAALQARGANVLAINARLKRTPPATLDALLAHDRGPAVATLARELFVAAGGKAGDSALTRLVGGYAFNAARLAKLFASSAR